MRALTPVILNAVYMRVDESGILEQFWNIFGSWDKMRTKKGHAFICPNKPWMVPKIIVNDGYSCKLSLGSIKSLITLPRFMEWTKMNEKCSFIYCYMHFPQISQKRTSFQRSTRRRAALLQIFYMNYRYTRSRCHPFTSAAINTPFPLYNLLCILVTYSAL